MTRILLSCLIALGFTFSALAEVRTTETVLSSCKRFPAFSVDQVRFKTTGPEVYGVYFYDLNFVLREHVLLLVTDYTGKPTYEKEFDREKPGRVHFEVSERVGNAQTVARDVNAYLKAQAIYACTN